MKRKTPTLHLQNTAQPMRRPLPASPSGYRLAGSRESLPVSLSQWPGFVLYWVASLGAQVYTAALAPLGLSPFDVGILSLLESDGPLVQARLGDKLHIDKATMVGLLNELESHGRIERRPHPHDGRAFEIHLLPAGVQCLRDAEQVSRTTTQGFFGVLSGAEQQTLHDLLARLATSHSSPVSQRDERTDRA